MLVKSCVYSNGDNGGVCAQDESPNKTRDITIMRNKYFIEIFFYINIDSASTNLSRFLDPFNF